MKYLLDTHAIIWYMTQPHQLPLKVKEIIADNSNKKYISSVSLWEIAIKANLGKLDIGSHFDMFIGKIRNSDFVILQIEDEYLKRLAGLPSIHKDPFDRLLITTTLVEELTIITADENVQKYDVPWIW